MSAVRRSIFLSHTFFFKQAMSNDVLFFPKILVLGRSDHSTFVTATFSTLICIK